MATTYPVCDHRYMACVCACYNVPSPGIRNEARSLINVPFGQCSFQIYILLTLVLICNRTLTGYTHFSPYIPVTIITLFLLLSSASSSAIWPSYNQTHVVHPLALLLRHPDKRHIADPKLFFSIPLFLFSSFNFKWQFT
jgi:hypothetical protein